MSLGQFSIELFVVLENFGALRVFTVSREINLRVQTVMYSHFFRFPVGKVEHFILVETFCEVFRQISFHIQDRSLIYSILTMSLVKTR